MEEIRKGRDTSGIIVDPKTRKEEINEVLEIFRYNLRLLRLQAKLTGEELSGRLMMPIKRIHDLEGNRVPPKTEDIICIVDYFDITYDDLLDDKILLHIKSRARQKSIL